MAWRFHVFCSTGNPYRCITDIFCDTVSLKRTRFRTKLKLCTVWYRIFDSHVILIDSKCKNTIHVFRYYFFSKTKSQLDPLWANDPWVTNNEWRRTDEYHRTMLLIVLFVRTMNPAHEHHDEFVRPGCWADTLGSLLLTHLYPKNFHDSSDICPMGFIYSIQICEISH